jgi:NADH-quinone oxidoreductase subunit H
MEAVSGTAFVVATVVKILVFFVLLLLGVALSTYMERKVAGFMQDRSGPNRVGPLGLLQVMADGLKFILKEEVTPGAAHKKFFILAPALALFPATVLFGVIPLGSPLPTPWGRVDMIVADVPIGFLYVLAIASLAVYGVVMAGWSSNSKYSFLGGLRGSAQMISYEIGLAMSLVPVLMLAGNVEMPVLVSMQQSFVTGPATYGMWFALPLMLAGFFFLVSGLAETNRVPFDLPEAEAEIVGGYHTEYSSMKFGMFFLGEYFHLITTAGLITIFFLGGWDIPFWKGDNIRVLADGTVIGDPAWWKTLLTLMSFTVKTVLLVAFFMFVRWTIPRFRYDQLMDLGWKVFIPALMAYIMLMAVAIYVLDTIGLSVGVRFSAALLGINVVLMLAFLFVLDRGRLIRGATARTRRPGGEVAAAVAAGVSEGD